MNQCKFKLQILILFCKYDFLGVSGYTYIRSQAVSLVGQVFFWIIITHFLKAYSVLIMSQNF